MTEPEASSPPEVGSPEFFRAIVETCADPIVVIDEEFVLRYASASIADVLGWDAADWVGRSIADLLHPDSLTAAAQGLADLQQMRLEPEWVGAPIRLLVKRASGDYLPVNATTRDVSRTGVSGFVVSLQPAGGAQALSDVVDALLDGGGADRIFESLIPFVEHNVFRSQATLCLGWNGDDFAERIGADGFVDFTARATPDRDAIESAMAAEGAVDIFGTLDTPTQRRAGVEGMAGCWCRAVPGRRPETAAGLLMVWTPETGPPGATYTRIFDRAVNLAALVLRYDESQRSLSWRATHDVLTRLMNRHEFQQRLASTAGRRRAVLLCDLDEFKPVNEELGHRVGDELLAAVAGRLRTACRGHAVARLGGDEFAVLIETLDEPDDAVGVAEAISGAFALPFAVADHHVSVGISVGVAYDGTGSVPPGALTDEADRLLREAKAAGKNRVHSARSVPPTPG